MAKRKNIDPQRPKCPTWRDGHRLTSALVFGICSVQFSLAKFVQAQKIKCFALRDWDVEDRSFRDLFHDGLMKSDFIVRENHARSWWHGSFCVVGIRGNDDVQSWSGGRQEGRRISIMWIHIFTRRHGLGEQMRRLPPLTSSSWLRLQSAETVTVRGALASLRQQSHDPDSQICQLMTSL